MGYEATGTLARVPLAGGAPREVLENVQDADWSPDGQSPRRLPCRRQPQPPRISDRQGALRERGLGQRRPRLARRKAHRFRRASSARQQRRLHQDHRRRRASSASRVLRFRGFAGLAWSPGGDEVWWGRHLRHVAGWQDTHGLGFAEPVRPGHRPRRQRPRRGLLRQARDRRLLRRRRSAPQPDGAELVLPRRHVAGRRTGSLLGAAAGQQLCARPRRLSGRTDRRVAKCPACPPTASGP